MSTEIGSFRGSADGGSVDVESNAWDSSSAPRAGWDAMLDSCEETKSASEYHFEKEMNCLPEQLMVLFYGVSSQKWFSGLSHELPCTLKIDMS